MIFETISDNKRHDITVLFQTIMSNADCDAIEDNASEARRLFETSADGSSIVSLLVEALAHEESGDVSDAIVELIRFFHTTDD